MLRLRTWDMNGRGIVKAKKTTKFMSNCPHARQELSRRCDRKHGHKRVLKNGAKLSERYPIELARTSVEVCGRRSG